MDYSVAATQPEYHPLLAALWPGDGYVDWLLFNVFKFQDQKGYSFGEVVNQSYSQFEALSGVPQVWEGETFTANYKDCAWGLGAWGVNGVQTWSHPDEADRVAWLQEAKEVLEAGTFPRLKLSLLSLIHI